MPSNFYGFQHERKRRGDTARQVGGIGAQAAVAIPEAIHQKKERDYVTQQRKAAAEAIKADTELASTNWTTWKETYSKQAAPLIKAGKMMIQKKYSSLKIEFHTQG